MKRRSLARGLAFALLAQALLVWNTGKILQEKGELLLDRQPRRFWEDLSLAIGHYQTGQLPVAYNAVQRWNDGQGTYYKERDGIITNAARKASLHPWRFWRPVPPRAVERLKLELFPRFDDVGRSWLLGKAFRLTGGVAPYLFFWLAVLLAFPILLWLAIELDLSGRPVAAFAASVGFGASAFLGDALTLSYSTAGFYVLGVLLLAAYAASMVLRAPGAAALLGKSLLAGIVLGLLIACRSGSLLLAPGFAAAALIGAWRLGGSRRWAGWVAACALLALPVLAVRSEIGRLTKATFVQRGQASVPPQHHAVWFGLWTGLGDFDREKGYLWNDAAASAFMVERGGSPLGPASYDPKNEQILREAILSDVGKDPWWYGRILIRRLGATLVQWNILPWKPWGGQSSQFDAPPGNYVDSYYTLTAHVDVARIYPIEVELPFAALVLGTLILVLVIRGRDAWLVGVIALGGLTLPVLITTAGAIEPMAAGLIHLLALALALDGLRRARRIGQRASGP